MSMQDIRDQYGVPAKRGMNVIANGLKGTIVGSVGGILRVRVEGEQNIRVFHPTWKMEYLA